MATGFQMNTINTRVGCSRCNETSSPDFTFCFNCILVLCSQCLSVRIQKKQCTNHITATMDAEAVQNILCQNHRKLYNGYCIKCTEVICEDCRASQHDKHEISSFDSCGPVEGHVDEALVVTKGRVFELIAKLKDGNNTLGDISQLKEDLNKLMQPFPQLHNLQLNVLRRVFEQYLGVFIITHFEAHSHPERMFILPWNIQVSISKSDGNDRHETTTLSVSDTVRRSESPASIGDASMPMLNNTPIWTRKTRYVYSMDVCPLTGNLLVLETHYLSRKICTYDLNSGDIIRTRFGHYNTRNISTEPNNGILGTAAYGGAVTLESQGPPEKFSIAKPLSVAFTRDGDIIVGCRKRGEGSFCRIDSSAGEILWKKSVTHSCHYIAIDSKNRIIISERDTAKRIYIYDQSGNYQTSFGGLGDPRGVCIDSQDNILVADGKKGAILVFDRNGKSTNRVILVDGSPNNVALYKDVSLYISTMTNNISLYLV